MAPSPPDGEDRRAERELLVRELLPVELREERLVLRRIVLRPSSSSSARRTVDEAVGHLPHVALEDADGDRRRVLEEVVDPGERVRVVGIRAAPHRRAARWSSRCPACARPWPLGPLGVAPAQVLQVADHPRDAARRAPASPSSSGTSHAARRPPADARRGRRRPRGARGPSRRAARSGRRAARRSVCDARQHQRVDGGQRRGGRRSSRRSPCRRRRRPPWSGSCPS